MKYLLGLVILAVLVSPVFAVGNVTITGRDLVPAGNYTNSNTSISMLNLSLNVTAGSNGPNVTITMINVSLGNGSTSASISAVEIYRDNDTTVIGSATVSGNSTIFNISLPNTLVVNTSNATIIIRFNISRNASTRQL